MKLFDIITIIQVLAGAPILLLSILIGLKIKKDLSKDLQGKWLIIITFMVFSLACYLLFVFILLFDRNFPLCVVTGTVFPRGACFVYLSIKITATTIQRTRYRSKNYCPSATN